MIRALWICSELECLESCEELYRVDDKNRQIIAVGLCKECAEGLAKEKGGTIELQYGVVEFDENSK